jgi:DNA polymerase-3 subunit alpha
VRNVGKNVVEAIVQARSEGPFTSFHDFLTRAPQQAATKRVVESLIRAGAFDSMGHPRRALLAIHESAIDSIAVVKRHAATGQMDLFGELEQDDDPTHIAIPDLPEWTKRDLLAHEREMLGLYVSDHPLAGLESLLAQHSDFSVAGLRSSAAKDGEIISVAGLITQVQHRVARSSGNPYGAVTLEDFTGELNVMVMGKTYVENRELLKPDQTVSVRGRVSHRDEEIGLQAFEFQVLDIGRAQGGTLQLAIRESMATRTLLEKLNSVLSAHPGPVEVQIKLGETRHFVLPHRVSVGPELFGELKSLLGADSVR